MFSLPAAAEYVVQVIDLKHKETQETKTVLFIYGDFDLGISEDVRTALYLHADKIDHAVLSSPGGLAYEGYKVGEILSEHKTPVRIAKGTACLSACAIAFIGGTNYEIDNGILGFHKAHLSGTEPFKNQEEAFDLGQGSGAYDMYYILSNGFSSSLTAGIINLTSPSKFIVFTDTDDLMEFYVRSDNDNLENYLKDIPTTPKVFESFDIIKYLDDNPNDRKWKVTKLIFEQGNERLEEDV